MFKFHILIDLETATSDLDSRTETLEEKTVDQETRLTAAEENIQGMYSTRLTANYIYDERETRLW